MFLPPESVPEIAEAHEPLQQKGAETQLEWAAAKVVGEGRGSGGRGVWVGSIGAPLSARGGQGQCVRREAAMVAPEHCTSLSSGACLLRWPELLQEYSWLQSSALPSPQTVSSQPTAVSFPDLLFTLPLRTLADTHLRHPMGCAGLWDICVGFPLSCLPVTGCCSLPRAPKLSFSPSWWPCWWGASPDARPSSKFHSPPGMQPHSACSILPFPFFFLSSYLITQESVLPLLYLRSSARIQQVLWEHFSICRCIFDSLWGEMSSMSSYSSAILLRSQDSWEVGQCGVHLYVFISVRWVSNVPTFISDFSNLNLYSSFLFSLPNGIIIWYFQRINFGFINFLHCFSFHHFFINMLIFIISSSCLFWVKFSLLLFLMVES